MRGHQIGVAGDDRQLPPTNFFRQVGDEGDEAAEDEESLVSFGQGFESVLEALRPLLPTWPLAWHYRSRDERLGAFSNAHIHGGVPPTVPWGVSAQRPHSRWCPLRPRPCPAGAAGAPQRH